MAVMKIYPFGLAALVLICSVLPAQAQEKVIVAHSARAAALIAAELGLDPATMQKVLEAHVRAHLDELAEGRIDLS